MVRIAAVAARQAQAGGRRSSSGLGVRLLRICNPQGETRWMMTDPRTLERLINYMRKAVWLIMAYSFGTMVGRLILLMQ